MFHQNSHNRSDNFHENREVDIMGEFLKIWEFILVIIRVTFAENSKFWFKTKILKFVGIKPSHKL